MTTAEPAWKKFLKLKSDVPVAAANLADNTGITGVKRKREALPAQKPSILKKPKESPGDFAEKKARANKQKKKAKTKTKRSKKDEADSKAAQTSALEYLSLYCTAKKEWKFSKQRQNYLLKHTYDEGMIPDDRFDGLLEYLRGLQGGAKERCLETAEGLIARYEKQQSGGDAAQEIEASDAKTDAKETEEEEEEVEDVTEDQFKRAERVKDKLTNQEEEEEEVVDAQAKDSDTSSSDSDTSTV